MREQKHLFSAGRLSGETRALGPRRPAGVKSASGWRRRGAASSQGPVTPDASMDWSEMKVRRLSLGRDVLGCFACLGERRARTLWPKAMITEVDGFVYCPDHARRERKRQKSKG